MSLSKTSNYFWVLSRVGWTRLGFGGVCGFSVEDPLRGGGGGEETSAAYLARDEGGLGQLRALGRPQRQSQQDWLVGWGGEQKKEAVPATPGVTGA